MPSSPFLCFFIFWKDDRHDLIHLFTLCQLTPPLTFLSRRHQHHISKHQPLSETTMIYSPGGSSIKIMLPIVQVYPYSKDVYTMNETFTPCSMVDMLQGLRMLDTPAALRLSDSISWGYGGTAVKCCLFNQRCLLRFSF